MNNAAATTPYRANALLTITAFALAACQLVLAPLIVLPQSPVLAGVLVVVLFLSTPFNSAVLHEAVHGRLITRSMQNDRVGRVLAICSGVAFDVLRFGHLSHHRFNRHALDRPDVIDPGQSRVYAAIRYYAHLLGGLYVSEILATLAMLLPRNVIDRLLRRAMAKDDPTLAILRRAASRGLDRRIARVRMDAVALVLLYGGAFYLYGAWWPLLLMGIILRGLIVSLQDNLPHYGTPAAIGASAHNATAPRWAALFMLNQNLHAVHHDRPELPWNALPDAVAPAERSHYGNYLALLVKQFRGPRPPTTAMP